MIVYYMQAVCGNNVFSIKYTKLAPFSAGRSSENPYSCKKYAKNGTIFHDSETLSNLCKELHMDDEEFEDDEDFDYDPGEFDDDDPELDVDEMNTDWDVIGGGD